MIRTASKQLIQARFAALVAVIAALIALAPSAQGAQAYRYYRFQQTALRGPNPNSIQLSELQVFFQGNRIAATAVTNPGGNNPAAETPPNANDNSVSTKWLDFNQLALVLDMGSPVIIDSYRFGTANDAVERDPVSWDFSGSNDNATFFLLDRQTNYPTTTARTTYEQFFSVINVSSISPVSGDPAGGAPVSISGTNFKQGATVTFGGNLATNVVVNSNTLITCTAPAGTVNSSVDVTVTNTTSSTSTLAGAFTYLTNPSPGVSSVFPNSGPTGGGTPVTITGAAFRTGASVIVGGQNGFTLVTIPAANVNVVSAGTITLTMPAAVPAGAAGPTTITVLNSDNTSGSLPSAYQYTAATPTITSISPNVGPYDSTTVVSIFGTNFAPNIANGGSVKFGGIAATNLTWNSSTSITATVQPAAANTTPVVDLIVSNPDGASVTSVAAFTFNNLRVPENPAGTQPGLYYRYYNFANQNTGGQPPTPNFTTITPAKVGIQTALQPFITAGTQPASTNPYDATNTGGFWSVQYTGYILIPTDGVWTFFTSSDDGSKLFIGNTLVVNNDFFQGSFERSGTIGLKAGTHAVKLQFAQGAGGFVFSTAYQGPNLAKTEIPSSAFSVDAPVITSFSPSHGPLAGGTPVTISGTGLGFIAPFGDNPILPAFTFGGTSIPFTIVNPQTITFNTPAGSSPGGVAVTLQAATGPAVSVAPGDPNGFTYDSATLTWLGGVSSKWSDAGNWDANRIPQTLDTVILTGAGNAPSIMDVPNLSVFGVTFDATTTAPITVTVTSPAAALGFTGSGGGISASAAKADHVVAGPINLNSVFNITVAAGRSLTLNGAISGPAATTLRFTGPGTLVLPNATSTYAGATIVGGGGTLKAATLAAAGSPSSIGAASALSSNLQLNANSILQLTSPANTTDRGMTLGAGNVTFDLGPNAMSVSGIVLGPGTLTKLGAGLLTMTNTANTIGGTFVTAGRVNTAGSGTLGDGPIAMANGTTLGVGTAGQALSGFGGDGTGWTLNGGPTIVGDVATMTSGATSQTRSIFNNIPRGYAAGFTASFLYQVVSPAGQVADGVTFCLQNVGPTALGVGGGSFGYGTMPTSAAIELNIYSGATPGANGIFFGQGGTIGVAAGSNTPVSPVNLPGGNTIKVTVTYTPPPTATLKVDLLDLVSNAVFTTTFANADLQALIGGTDCYVGFTGATGGVASTQTVRGFTYAPVSSPYSNNVSITGNVTVDVSATAVIPAIKMGKLSMGSSAALNVTANVSTPSGQAYGLTFGTTTMTDATPSFTMANNGAGIGTLTLGSLDDGFFTKTISKFGPGAMILNKGATSLVDGTVFNLKAGTLKLSDFSALTSVCKLDMTAGTTLNLNAVIAAIGMVSGTGTVNLNGCFLTVGDPANNLSGTFSGTIADGSTAGTLVKDGTGTWTLAAGSTHTHSGATTVSSGTLTLDGTLSLSTGITVNGGATLRGTGSLTVGTATVTGTLFPGNTPLGIDAKGTLTMAGLVVNSGGTVKLRASGNSTAVATDSVSVTGSTVTLNQGAGLQLLLTLSPGTYNNLNAILINSTAGNPVAQSFSSVFLPSSHPPVNGLTVNYVDSADSVQSSQIIPSNGAFNGGGGVMNPVKKVVLNLNASVTPVTVDSFSARREGAGVAVEWSASSEFQNAGYNVYRRAAEGLGIRSQEPAWTRINPAMIAGRITDAGAKTYRFCDWAPTGVFEYRLETIDSRSGYGSFYSKLTRSVAMDMEGIADSVSGDGLGVAVSGLESEHVSLRGAELSARFDAGYKGSNSALKNGVALIAEREPRLALNADGSVPNAARVREISANEPHAAYAVAENAASRSAALVVPEMLPRFLAKPASVAPSKVAKVVYHDSGVLRVPQSMLPAGFEVGHLRVQREGRTVQALAVSGDSVLLYAPGYADDYTDKDAFFLSASGGPTAAGVAGQASELFTDGVAAQTFSGASVLKEFHDVYFDWNLRPYDYPPYFSGQYLTQGTTQSFTTNVESADAGAGTLTVNAWSLTTGGGSPDHALQAFVNGTAAGQAVWTGGGKFVALTFQIPAGALTNGENRIDLVTPVLNGVTTQIALLHSLNIVYTRTLSGNGRMEITHAGNAAQVYEMSGLANPAMWVVDARYADRAALVPYETRTQADGSISARFTAQPGGTGKYLVVPTGLEGLPIAVSRRTLKAAPSVAYLATGPAQFASSVQSLLTARTKEGIRGTFVDQEQLFDYYGYGRFGPDGIRNAVRSVRPQYLLLTGRTTYDYRDYSGAGVDPLCPSFLVATTFWAQTMSDATYGDLGRGFPEVKVGRIPANSPSECAAAVTTILAYKGMGASGWRGQLSADAFDAGAGDFAAEANSIASAHPSIAWSRNYLGVTSATSPEIGAAMAQAANGEADLLIYNGHGSSVHLGVTDPHILDANTVQTWNGNVVFIAATCTFNWVAKNQSGYANIPTAAMTKAQGGMAASIGTSTYMNSEPAVAFVNQLLTQSQASDGARGPRWGSVLMRAQQWAYTQSKSRAADAAWYLDLSRTESILGDPAMPVQLKSAPANGTVTGVPANPVSTGAF